ncbi:MAG: HAD family hydrolase [Gemmatimonadaceae bacterium]
MIAPPTTVFLDRDGTVIRDASYLSRVDDVELLPGAAGAIARLNERDIPVIVVTNQSGIARGFFTVAEYLQIQTRLDTLLAADGARIDATYYCPDHPDVGGPCDCRKPGSALFERAAREHALDMTSPAYIGDRWRDIEVYRKLGGTPVLINGSATPLQDVDWARKEGATIVASLPAAVDLLLAAVSE